jgi:hypothetical protein
MSSDPLPRAAQGSAGTQRGSTRVAVTVGVAIVAAVAITLAWHETDRPTRTQPPTPTPPEAMLLDHTGVEHTIERSGYTDVVCDNGISPPVHPRVSFSCVAAGAQHIAVTILNKKGDYVWTPTS